MRRDEGTSRTGTGARSGTRLYPSNKWLTSCSVFNMNLFPASSNIKVLKRAGAKN